MYRPALGVKTNQSKRIECGHVFGVKVLPLCHDVIRALAS